MQSGEPLEPEPSMCPSGCLLMAVIRLHPSALKSTGKSSQWRLGSVDVCDAIIRLPPSELKSAGKSSQWRPRKPCVVSKLRPQHRPESLITPYFCDSYCKQSTLITAAPTGFLHPIPSCSFPLSLKCLIFH